MNLTAALRALLERRDLTHTEMTEVMRALMSGEAKRLFTVLESALKLSKAES